LERQIERLADADTTSVARAFSYFLHLSNIAEDRDQNRRKRRQELAADMPGHGSLQHVLDYLKEQGIGPRKIRRFLEDACIVPDLTAHPTEVQRKITLDMHRDSAGQLAHSDDELTPSERARLEQRLAGLVAALWQTRMMRQQKLTVLDEIDNALNYY